MRLVTVGFWSMVRHRLQQDPNEGIDNPNLMILVPKGVLVGSSNHGVPFPLSFSIFKLGKLGALIVNGTSLRQYHSRSVILYVCTALIHISHV